jgi:DNA-binding MarR family transcriptional regulator
MHHMTASLDSAVTKCVAGTLRRASRSIARVYDSRFAAVGLTTTQFSILRAIDEHDAPMPLSLIARDLVFERTSLYRALAPLERDGLITLSVGPRRAKLATLTAKGARRVAQATPLWIAAQEEFLGHFGKGAWNDLSGRLVEVLDVGRSMGSAETTG